MGRTKRLNHKKTRKRPRSRKKSRVRKDTLKRRYAFMRTLKKSKTKKKAIKDVVKAGLRKEDSSKYIGLLNLALKHIYQGSKIDDVFLSSDNVLWSSGFLEKGMLNGFKLIKSTTNQLDPHCNTMCLSNALLSWTILKLDYHELSDLQGLYLFFLDYLNREGNDNRSAYLPFDYVIMKLDKKIETAKQYLEKKEKVGNAKSIKTAQKNIDKLKKELDDYKKRYADYSEHISPWVFEPSVKKESWTYDGETLYDDPYPTWHPRKSVDICDSTDCLFLNGEANAENPELVKPIGKFCDNLILIFKGIIWLLMKEFSASKLHLYNTQVAEPEPELEPEPEPADAEPEPEQEYSAKITLDMSIHTLLQNVDCVLIPSSNIFWARYTSDTSLRRVPWVYTNLHKVGSEYMMDKMNVSDLTDKFYLTALLHWNEDIDEQAAFDDFIKNGSNPESGYPILRCIEIEENQLPDGTTVPQLQEMIEGSITQHWYVAGKKDIRENVILMARAAPPPAPAPPPAATQKEED